MLQGLMGAPERFAPLPILSHSLLPLPVFFNPRSRSRGPSSRRIVPRLARVFTVLNIRTPTSLRFRFVFFFFLFLPFGIYVESSSLLMSPLFAVDQV